MAWQCIAVARGTTTSCAPRQSASVVVLSFVGSCDSCELLPPSAPSRHLVNLGSRRPESAERRGGEGRAGEEDKGLLGCDSCEPRTDRPTTTERAPSEGGKPIIFLFLLYPPVNFCARTRKGQGGERGTVVSPDRHGKYSEVMPRLS